MTKTKRGLYQNNPTSYEQNNATYEIIIKLSSSEYKGLSTT